MIRVFQVSSGSPNRRVPIPTVLRNDCQSKQRQTCVAIFARPIVPVSRPILAVPRHPRNPPLVFVVALPPPFLFSLLCYLRRC